MAVVEEALVLAEPPAPQELLTPPPAVKRKPQAIPSSPDKAVEAEAAAAEASPECPSSGAEAEAVVEVAEDSAEAVACRSTPEPTWSA